MSNAMGDMAEDSVVYYAGINPSAHPFQSFVDISIAGDGVSVVDQPEGLAPGGNGTYRIVKSGDNTGGVNPATPPQTYHLPFGALSPRTNEVARIFYNFFPKLAAPTLVPNHPSSQTTPGTIATFKEGDSILIQKGVWPSGIYGVGAAQPTPTLKAQAGTVTTEGSGLGVIPSLDFGVTVNLAAGEDIAMAFVYQGAVAVGAVGVFTLVYIGLSTAVI